MLVILYPDGRVTTVPVHKNQDLPKGLLRKIIQEDLELDPKAVSKHETRLSDEIV